MTTLKTRAPRASFASLRKGVKNGVLACNAEVFARQFPQLNRLAKEHRLHTVQINGGPLVAVFNFYTGRDVEPKLTVDELKRRGVVDVLAAHPAYDVGPGLGQLRRAENV